MSGTNQSYAARAIDVTFVKSKTKEGVQTTFQSSGTDTLTVSGLRVSLEVSKKGISAGYSQAVARIYGLTQSVMNDLSTLGLIIANAEQQNKVQFFAGNEGAPLAKVFEGIVNNAWVNYDDAPNVFLELGSQTGLYSALNPVPPLSFPGTVDVASALANLAGQMGMSFENNNVTGVTLPSSYFPGTALQQAKAIANAAGINLTIDDDAMVIFPAGGARAGKTVAMGPDTGMIGYPKFTNFGMTVRTIYNPAIRIGGLIKVTSSIGPAANGTFVIGNLIHSLESQVFNGRWETLVNVLIAGYPTVQL